MKGSFGLTRVGGVLAVLTGIALLSLKPVSAEAPLAKRHSSTEKNATYRAPDGRSAGTDRADSTAAASTSPAPERVAPAVRTRRAAYPVFDPIVVDYRKDEPSRLRSAGRLVGAPPLRTRRPQHFGSVPRWPEAGIRATGIGKRGVNEPVVRRSRRYVSFGVVAPASGGTQAQAGEDKTYPFMADSSISDMHFAVLGRVRWSKRRSFLCIEESGI